MGRDQVIAYYRNRGKEPPKEVLQAEPDVVFAWGFTMNSRGCGSAPLHRIGRRTKDGLYIGDNETEEEARERHEEFKKMAEESARKYAVLNTMTPKEQEEWWKEEHKRSAEFWRKSREEWEALPEEERRRRLQACEDVLRKNDHLELYDGLSLDPSMEGLKKKINVDSKARPNPIEVLLGRKMH